uniref:Uncharacterized protein n=1 Tax=Panagrolaimus davidi TaxID=227884 RepID=A0A914Q1C8_9BILA
MILKLVADTKIGGPDVVVEFFIDKNYLEETKWKYPEGERRFNFVVFALSWETVINPSKIIMCPTTYPTTTMIKNDIIKCIADNVKDGTKIVAPESFFDNIGGYNEFSKQAETFAKTEADINIKVKTTESLTRLSPTNAALLELRNTSSASVTAKTGICGNYVSRYMFYRHFPQQRLNNYFRIISEEYFFLNISVNLLFTNNYGFC